MHDGSLSWPSYVLSSKAAASESTCHSVCVPAQQEYMRLCDCVSRRLQEVHQAAVSVRGVRGSCSGHVRR
jgi:hypothetical protein